MSEELRVKIANAIYSLAAGPGARFEAVSEQPDLMTLDCAVAEATGEGRSAALSDEVAGVVIRFLEEAADSLTPDPDSGLVPNPAKAARAALGLKPELHARPYTAIKGREGRQQVIAEWLDIAKESLENPRQDGTSPLSDVLGPMAQYLTRKEVDYRVEARRLAQRAERPPLESAMRVEWLGRFERYYRIWTPIFGLRHNLELALKSARDGMRGASEVYVRIALYNHAFFLTQLDAFILQHGGLWILPNTQTEDAIADSTWFLREPMPLSKIDESMLRVKFVANSELVMFMHVSYIDADLQPILERWREWALSCRCKRPKRPRADCKVHATIRWTAFYMDALDAQWDFLADWHDLPRSGSQVDSTRGTRTLPVLPPSHLLTN